MPSHTTGTPEEWRTARRELLVAEKELTRQSDEVARQRRELPWVPLDKHYHFETEDGSVSLADLFGGRSQLLVYHFMFGPEYAAGCPSCSAIADGFNGFVVHLQHHDVAFAAVSLAPVDAIRTYKRRMGWTFPWASSYGSDFNFDLNVSFTEDQQGSGTVDYNYGPRDLAPKPGQGPIEHATMCGVDSSSYMRQAPGMSAFALADGIVYHTYSSFARGLDSLWGMYQWLDRAPKGRNESGPWWRRHDEYGTEE